MNRLPWGDRQHRSLTCMFDMQRSTGKRSHLSSVKCLRHRVAKYEAAEVPYVTVVSSKTWKFESVSLRQRILCNLVWEGHIRTFRYIFTISTISTYLKIRNRINMDIRSPWTTSPTIKASFKDKPLLVLYETSNMMWKLIPWSVFFNTQWCSM